MTEEIKDLKDVKDLKDLKDKKKQTQEEMDLEFRRLEIEAKKLELMDIRDRIADRQRKRDDLEQRKRSNGQVLDNNLTQRRAVQAQCNHRKGGNGLEGYVGGKGDDPQYAILKHQFLNGDIWVRCLRCGKWWKPPVELNFYFDERGREVAPADGKFDKVKFDQAWSDYRLALEFQTKNSMSTSYRFSFSDNGKYYREVTKDTDHT